MTLLFHANTPTEAIEAVRQHLSDLINHYHRLAKHEPRKAMNSNLVRATAFETLADNLTHVIILPKKGTPK